jgi:hypothetical protein
LKKEKKLLRDQFGHLAYDCCMCSQKNIKLRRENEKEQRKGNKERFESKLCFECFANSK